MGMNRNQRWCSSFMAAICTGAQHVSQTTDKKWPLTAKRTQALREAGFRVDEKWACEFQKTGEP